MGKSVLEQRAAPAQQFQFGLKAEPLFIDHPLRAMQAPQRPAWWGGCLNPAWLHPLHGSSLDKSWSYTPVLNSTASGKSFYKNWRQLTRTMMKQMDQLDSVRGT